MLIRGIVLSKIFCLFVTIEKSSQGMKENLAMMLNSRACWVGLVLFESNGENLCTTQCELIHKKAAIRNESVEEIE